jgi:hypothetical protein
MAVEDAVTVEPVGEFALKGIRRPLAAYNVLATKSVGACTKIDICVVRGRMDLDPRCRRPSLSQSDRIARRHYFRATETELQRR